MKTKVNNKLVKAVTPRKSAKSAKSATDGISTSDMISAIVERSTLPLNPTITSVTTPVVDPFSGVDHNPAIVDRSPVSAPVSAGVVMGVPNLNSRRINPRAVVRSWRIAHNQRKEVFSSGAKYYVQGGEIQTDPQTLRDRFEVAIEIPFVDHYLAKLEWVARTKSLALASAPPVTTEVTKIA